jgi:hypothetical protein
MNIRRILVQSISGMLTFTTLNLFANVLFVNVNSTNPTPPYSTWINAATAIQDAVDLASTGDEIVVTNGVYSTGGRAVLGVTTNRVAVTKPLTVRSVNGASVTTIQGHQAAGSPNGDGAVRCVYLVSGASLVGFTLVDGATMGMENGGGVCSGVVGGAAPICSTAANCASILTCRIVGNSAQGFGGGVSGGYLVNCVLEGNTAQWGGGAAFALLNSCSVSNNSAVATGSCGGGAAACILNKCLITRNTAANGGGFCGGELNGCILVGNVAALQGGGVARSGAFGDSLLNNCTVIGNSAGEAGGGSSQATMNNCIVYFGILGDRGQPPLPP